MRGAASDLGSSVLSRCDRIVRVEVRAVVDRNTSAEALSGHIDRGYRVSETLGSRAKPHNRYPLDPAGVAESVDAADLNSAAREGVRVRIRLRHQTGSNVVATDHVGVSVPELRRRDLGSGPDRLTPREPGLLETRPIRAPRPPVNPVRARCFTPAP